MMTKYETQAGPLPGQGVVPGSLAERIEGHIEIRLCGRIHDLHVACAGAGVVLQGRSRTYHAKQLAQEAALDLMTDRPPRLVNEIVVF